MTAPVITKSVSSIFKKLIHHFLSVRSKKVSSRGKFYETFPRLQPTCQSLEDCDVLEAFEIVNEHVGDPEILQELQRHWVPEPGLYTVVGPDPALLPHHTEVHGHRDGELLVIDGEDVQNLHIDVHIDRGVWSGGLKLLIIFRKTPTQDTFQHV